MLPPSRPDLMTVPSVPSSVSAVRRFAVEACRRSGLGQVSDTVALLVSEVATNALVHGSGDVRVSVVAAGHLVRVEVADDSPGWPRPRRAGPEAEGGRGLALVEALSSSWGTRAEGEGKVVWFEITG